MFTLKTIRKIVKSGFGFLEIFLLIDLNTDTIGNVTIFMVGNSSGFCFCLPEGKSEVHNQQGRVYYPPEDSAARGGG